MLSFLPPALAAPTLSIPSLSILLTPDSGREMLSMQVQEASLHLLLTEIAAQARFELIELVPTERTVSAICYRAQLDQALTHILQSESLNFLFVYSGKGLTRLKRIIVVGTHSRGPSVPDAHPSPSPKEGECVTLAAGDADTLTPEPAEEVSSDVPLEQLLEWTTHWDPQMRATALEALSLHRTDERAHEKVIKSVSDPDPYVRSISLGILGPLVTKWPEAETALMTALGDPEPSVRRHALMILGEKSGPRTGEALTIALQDNDPAIRAQAREFLQIELPADN
jgi:hypothetical protein